jgi:hypothetical protein
LSAENATVAATATASRLASSRARKGPSASAKPAASVAIVPAKIAKNESQPNTKPAPGWKASRR